MVIATNDPYRTHDTDNADDAFRGVRSSLLIGFSHSGVRRP